MKHLFIPLLLSLFCRTRLLAEDITGTICDESNSPIAGVIVSIRTLDDDKIVTSTETTSKGSFVVSGLEVGRYVLLCSHVAYASYTAEVQVPEGQDLSLGIIVMNTKDVRLKEVVSEADRNVFTTDGQTIYPSKQQIEASGGGLDLLQKLPIPLLEVNPFNRTVTSYDPRGGVSLLINGIPATPNDFVIIDPKTVVRVDVIRKPGLEYGQNLAMVVNFIVKRPQDGVSLGVNGTNSMKATNGYNNIYATWYHKNSQLTVNQSENYTNYSDQTSEDSRHYLQPSGEWHDVNAESLSSRMRSATHGTTLTYNLTNPNKFVLQIRGYMNLYRNPKQDRYYLNSETGEDDYVSHTHIRDRNQSPALNVYFQKYLPKRQSLIINVVGTYIGSNYDYLYEMEGSTFETSYGVEGRKYSAICEMKYSNVFNWGSFVSGVRSIYGNTQNSYANSTDGTDKMDNVNSNLYAGVNGRWKKLSGNATLSLDDQYYNQQDYEYHKLTFIPQANLNYSISPKVSLGYGFNLASRLPSLASLNDITFQLDRWELRTGNPSLKPFNHVENSLSATYYNPKLYAMFNAVYATNRHAIMPTVTRTEVDGQTFFVNSSQNQRNMRQLVLTAYLRYAAFKNKLVVSGTGSYNHYYADSELYSNKRGFFFGTLKIESYLGKFYLYGSVQSRYNSLFAETVWYNEYSSALSASYKWKNLQISLAWEQPLQRGGTNNRVETLNNIVCKTVRQSNPQAGNNVLLTISWNWSHGFKSKTEQPELDNKDTEAGILK